jgi:RimJ/RimL family protein N-acetyltransferase
MAVLSGHWMLRGFGVWAVEERESGAFAGRIGCLQPEGWPGFEVAYTLAKPFWGRGYAREGVGAALAFARETLGRDHIISIIRPANEASIRVAEWFGAVHDGDVEFFGSTSRMYRYPRR